MSTITKNATKDRRVVVFQPSPRTYAARARSEDIRRYFAEMSADILLTEHEAARVIGFAANSMKYWRLHGDDRAPPSVRVLGGVRYRVGDLRAWLGNLAK